MSTKIYTGFKLNINNDIKSLQDFVLNLRKDIEDLATKQFIELVASRITMVYDKRDKLKEEEKKLVSKKTGLPLAGKVNDEIYKWVTDQANSSLRNPLLDLCFELCIFEHNGSIYGMYFCDNVNFERHFMSLQEVEDFHYQNQTDPPDDIPEKDWDKREEVWEEILNRSSISVPAECGISIDIYKPSYNLLSWCFFFEEEDAKKRDELLRKHMPERVEYRWTENIT